MQTPNIYKSEPEIPAREWRRVEAFDGALRELFLVRNPQWKKGMSGFDEARDTFVKSCAIQPIWIAYSEAGVLVRTVPEEIYFELRTSRNRDIISPDEQAAYRNCSVGIAGLSVGSAILAALVRSGGPKRIKIADFDVLEVTNLNRLQATLLDVGESKAEIAARGIYAIDPFAELTVFANGVNRENIKDFILGNPKLDVCIDEMDMIDCKILSRIIAREARIPVLMATDNGDGVILDVERFDLEPDRKLFHGALGDIHFDNVKDLDYKAWLALATKIVSPEYLTERMQDSLLEIGTAIPAVPQLGTTASIAGSAMAFAVRRIASGEELPSGRYTIGCEEKLIPQYMSEASRARRAEKTQEFMAKFGKA